MNPSPIKAAYHLHRHQPRTGVAIDKSYITNPTPVELILDKQLSRQSRSIAPSLDNALLNETKWNNNINDLSKWRGNGFKGAVGYVPNCLTRDPIRPCHLDKDLQRRTFPIENTMPLNTSQMPEGCIPLDSRVAGTAEIVLRAKENLEKQRAGWRHAEQHQKNCRQFNYFEFYEELQNKKERIKIDAQCLKDSRPAGMGSINPSLGTAGKLVNLKNLRGNEGLNTWRTICPNQTGGNLNLVEGHIDAWKYHDRREYVRP